MALCNQVTLLQMILITLLGMTLISVVVFMDKTALHLHVYFLKIETKKNS